MLIKLGYSFEAWKKGRMESAYHWNTDQVPHILIAGITGGSKTVTAQMIVNQLLNNNDTELFICDFKAGNDWNEKIARYAAYSDCDRLLRLFYESFLSTIEKKAMGNHYLLFDEFTSFALSKDSKGFKEIMAMISHIAFMGRSFGYHLIFIGQQMNSKVLDTAIREQFGIKIYMGSTISTESATMLFPNSEINKGIHLPRFCGYISMPERELEIIQIPFLSEPQKLIKLLENKGQNRRRFSD